MWYRNFTIAFWLLLAMAWCLIIFTESTWQSLLFMAGSLVFWYLRGRNEMRHAEWHLENDEEVKDYDFKP
jgi:hypothetical protein